MVLGKKRSKCLNSSLCYRSSTAVKIHSYIYESSPAGFRGVPEAVVLITSLMAGRDLADRAFNRNEGKRRKLIRFSHNMGNLQSWH